MTYHFIVTSKSALYSIVAVLLGVALIFIGVIKKVPTSIVSGISIILWNIILFVLEVKGKKRLVDKLSDYLTLFNAGSLLLVFVIFAVGAFVDGMFLIGLASLGIVVFIGWLVATRPRRP